MISALVWKCPATGSLQATHFSDLIRPRMTSLSKGEHEVVRAVVTQQAYFHQLEEPGALAKLGHSLVLWTVSHR